MTLAEYYQRLYETRYCAVAGELRRYIRELVGEHPSVDRIDARAKRPESFLEKARRTDETGSRLYDSPLTEVQDIIGARVVVIYRSEVSRIVEVLTEYFRHIEDEEVVPESQWKFGYFGRHLIVALPGDVVPAGADRDGVPAFFELQVKSLFQHAWSEANHDLGYKSPGPVEDVQKRKLAYTAAQAWGADQVFDELKEEIASASDG